MLTGKSNIGYSLSSETTNVFQTFNPQLNQKNPTLFHEPTQNEIETACSLSWKAFKVYRKETDENKATFLSSIVKHIRVIQDELYAVYQTESGLPIERAKAELDRTLNQIENFSKQLKEGKYRMNRYDMALPDRQPKPKPELRKSSIGIGPVLVFGASNFPFAYSTIGGDSVSALAAGCPVIVKSHPMHAGTGELMTQAIVKAAKENNLPDGVFCNINSKGIKVGQTLVENNHIKAIGFTGSIKGGRAIMDLAAQRSEPIPVFAEMGSQNPVIFFEGALQKNSEHWSSIYAEAITNSAGQFCTNPGLLVGLKSASFQKFIETLGDKIAKIEAKCMLHPNIWENYSELKEKSNHLSESQIIVEDKTSQPNFSAGNIIKVSGQSYLQNRFLQQEVFGPFSVIVECSSEKEIIEIIENMEGQLTGTLIFDERSIPQNLDEYIDELEIKVGRIILNGVPIGGEVCPSMHHGGPYPASSDSRFTALGDDSIQRWLRPISYQNFRAKSLPNHVKNEMF